MASGSRRIIMAALIGNSLIAATKFIAASITGSSAMLSEGIHSVVDTGNQVLLLYCLHYVARGKDPTLSVVLFENPAAIPGLLSRPSACQ